MEAIFRAGVPLDRDELEVELARAAGLALYLDFDGTLAPLVADPAEAHMPVATRKILERLSRCARVTVVSGRSIEDLRARVGLPLIYAGNHGVEIEGPGMHFCDPRAAAGAAALREMCRRLETWLNGIPGAIVDYKRLSASVHYRQVPAAMAPIVAAAVAAETARYPEFFAGTGNKVYNIRPRIEWNKGSAARWIDERAGIPGEFTLCAGDDLTDEDLFAAFPEGSIRVGAGGPTAARWRVAGYAEFATFLDWLADHLPASSVRQD